MSGIIGITKGLVSSTVKNVDAIDNAIRTSGSAKASSTGGISDIKKSFDDILGKSQGLSETLERSIHGKKLKPSNSDAVDMPALKDFVKPKGSGEVTISPKPSSMIFPKVEAKPSELQAKVKPSDVTFSPRSVPNEFPKSGGHLEFPKSQSIPTGVTISPNSYPTVFPKVETKPSDLQAKVKPSDVTISPRSVPNEFPKSGFNTSGVTITPSIVPKAPESVQTMSPLASRSFIQNLNEMPAKIEGLLNRSNKSIETLDKKPGIDKKGLKELQNMSDSLQKLYDLQKNMMNMIKDIRNMSFSRETQL